MKRLPMRKIKDALRLAAAGLSQRRIAASLGVGRTTAAEYLERARRAGLAWPLPEGLDDEALERLLFPAADPATERPQPDWAHIHRELRKRSVTLRLLWEEHRAVHTQGYCYSQFCEHYRRWKGRLTPTMRQVHTAGEKMFVDYAGQTIEVIDGLTGEVRKAQLFVAALGGWTIALRHGAGSLDAAVNQARRRNVVISFSILLVAVRPAMSAGPLGG